MGNQFSLNIQNLLKRIDNKEITVAEVEGKSGVSKMMISNLRTGKTSIDKIQLKIALSLANLERSLQLNDGGHHREALYGQLWGVFEAMSAESVGEIELITENDKAQFSKTPLTIFFEIHKRAILEATDLYIKYADKLHFILEQFEDNEFNNEPLDISYLLSAAAKQVELYEEFKQKK